MLNPPYEKNQKTHQSYSYKQMWNIPIRDSFMKNLVILVLIVVCSSIANAETSRASQEIEKIEARLHDLKVLWQIDLDIINSLTNYKRTPVQEGTQAYYACYRASQRINQVEAEAKTLQARKAKLELNLRQMPEKPKSMVSDSRGLGNNTDEVTPSHEYTRTTGQSIKKEKPASDITVKTPARMPTESSTTGRNPKTAYSDSRNLSRPTPTEAPVTEGSNRATQVPNSSIKSNYKPSEAGALKMLQEVRDALPSQSGELEFLEKRMEEINDSLLAGMKMAVRGTQPFQDLERSHHTLMQIADVLSNPEKCSYKKSIDIIGEQLAVASIEYEEKGRKTQTGKAVYLEMFKETERMKNKVNKLQDRFKAMKQQVDVFIKDASDWINLYRDVLQIKGEAVASKKLIDVLEEAEKTQKKR